MKNNIKIGFLLFLVGFMVNQVSAQKISNDVVNAVKEYSKKKQKNEYLSMKLLRSATEIIYGFNNGSVAPDYHYQGYIIVKPNNVTLKIYHMSSVCYNSSKSITSSQYSSFLNNLFRLGVKPNPEEPLMLCGGDVTNIHIKKNNTTLFKGTEDEDIVTTKGRLSDAFEPLLDSGMKKVYDSPSVSFDIDNSFVIPEELNY